MSEAREYRHTDVSMDGPWALIELVITKGATVLTRIVAASGIIGFYTLVRRGGRKTGRKTKNDSMSVCQT